MRYRMVRLTIFGGRVNHSADEADRDADGGRYSLNGCGVAQRTDRLALSLDREWLSLELPSPESSSTGQATAVLRL